MKIIISEQSPTDPSLLQTVIGVWQEHPLRSYSIDLLMETVTLVVEESEDKYSLNPDSHPKYVLKCAPTYPYVSIPIRQVVFHELTHLIDRFNPNFTGGISSEEVIDKILAIPMGGINSLLRKP